MASASELECPLQAHYISGVSSLSWVELFALTLEDILVCLDKISISQPRHNTVLPKIALLLKRCLQHVPHDAAFYRRQAIPYELYSMTKQDFTCEDLHATIPDTVPAKKLCRVKIFVPYLGKEFWCYSTFDILGLCLSSLVRPQDKDNAFHIRLLALYGNWCAKIRDKPLSVISIMWSPGGVQMGYTGEVLLGCSLPHFSGPWKIKEAIQKLRFDKLRAIKTYRAGTAQTLDLSKECEPWHYGNCAETFAFEYASHVRAKDMSAQQRQAPTYRDPQTGLTRQKFQQLSYCAMDVGENPLLTLSNLTKYVREPCQNCCRCLNQLGFDLSKTEQIRKQASRDSQHIEARSWEGGETLEQVRHRQAEEERELERRRAFQALPARPMREDERHHERRWRADIESKKLLAEMQLKNRPTEEDLMPPHEDTLRKVARREREREENRRKTEEKYRKRHPSEFDDYQSQSSSYNTRRY